jgi:hypothetical protein
VTGKNILHTHPIDRRRLPRWIAAGAIGAALLLGGCANSGVSERGWHPFAKNAGAGGGASANGHPGADSFPTAREAGL